MRKKRTIEGIRIGKLTRIDKRRLKRMSQEDDDASKMARKDSRKDRRRRKRS